MPRQSVRAILLDIEGTTTPVDFVYEILFPFARQNVREFLQQRYQSDQVRAALSALRVEKSAENPEDGGRQPPPWDEGSTNSLLESVTQYVYWLMDQDRKSTALKALQGQIWKGGYLDGQLQSQIYPDVLPAFKRWKEQQRDIHVFSSGSVLAQKLLFAHTTEGDLTGFISGYFDTTTGAKTHATSYRSISEKIGIRSTEVLFVSDVNAELDAARESGMETILCVRAGNLETGSAEHQITHDFNEVFP